MQESQAIIERVKRVSATIQRLEVAVDRAHQNAGPGQTFLARMTLSLDPYLREPWTPIRREASCLIFERAAGTVYTPGQVVSLIGPVGKPIPLRENIRTLLLIAHESAPVSLLYLAETALAKGIAVTLVLGGAAVHYPLEALPQEVEVIRADDDGHWAEQPEAFRWAEQIFSVAPPPFDIPYYTKLLENARTTRVEVSAQYIFGLFQPPLPCGVGACQACLIRRDGEEVATCLEGPAFDLTLLNALRTEGT
jgi:hypothetical protein